MVAYLVTHIMLEEITNTINNSALDKVTRFTPNIKQQTEGLTLFLFMNTRESPPSSDIAWEDFSYSTELKESAMHPPPFHFLKFCWYILTTSNSILKWIDVSVIGWYRKVIIVRIQNMRKYSISNFISVSSQKWVLTLHILALNY